MPRVIGLILTGGFRPPEPVLEALRDAGIFAYLVRTDTYRTAQAVDEILVKTHAADIEKISTIIELVDGALDVDALLRAAVGADFAARDNTKGGRTWAPAGLPCTGGAHGRRARASVTAASYDRWRPALVLSMASQTLPPRRRPSRAACCR